jgi:endonuclease/exonuclease/phosphatase family metal-dependent hydrolase
MSKIRLATFNCENLFARYKFERTDVDMDNILEDGWLANETLFEINDPVSKELTGKAIDETNADVIALQEVESLAALRRFKNQYLSSSNKRKYKYTLVLDGNDPRLIDVGVMSKYPIISIDTHIHEWNNEINWFTFSRDCLECDIALPDGKKIRLFINHFKSMFDINDPCNGRKNSRNKRLIQSKRVKDIVLNKFPNGDGSYAILGDLNDYLETDGQGATSIGDLANWDVVENIVLRKEPQERWTHFYDGNSDCNHPKTYKQLDYILLSKTLADANSSIEPEIVRKGLPLNADRYTGPRFDGIGQEMPSASDHCPVVVEIEV